MEPIKLPCYFWEYFMRFLWAEIDRKGGPFNKTVAMDMLRWRVRGWKAGV